MSVATAVITMPVSMHGEPYMSVKSPLAGAASLGSSAIILPVPVMDGRKKEYVAVPPLLWTSLATTSSLPRKMQFRTVPPA